MSARCVHVVDDEGPVRRSMQLMLGVIGYDARTFESGTAFLDMQGELDSGCVLLDLRMPDVDGLEVQRRLRVNGADHSVVAMSGHGDLGVAVSAMEQGAVAFLEKPFSRAALQEVLDLGFMRLEDPDTYRAYLRSAAAALQDLNPTEQRVLELIARGHDTTGIAEQTGLSAATIELSRSRIFAGLGADTVVEVLRLVFAAGRASPH